MRKGGNGLLDGSLHEQEFLQQKLEDQERPL